MNIIITAGGTEEKIDEVRKITNMSTGALGAVIAEEILSMWDKENWQDLSNENVIFYICNKKSVKPQYPAHMKNHIKIIETTDTNSVQEAIQGIPSKENISMFIHSMAISDYRVRGAYKQVIYGDGFPAVSNMIPIDTSSKMKSDNDEIFLKLVKTPKIIDGIKNLFQNASLISFKLMNDVTKEDLIQTARNQAKRTGSDVVIANDLKIIKEGVHKAFAVSENSEKTLNGKQEIAKYIIKLIKNYLK